MRIFKNKALREAILYIFCGGVTTAINLAIFYGLTELGVYYLISNTVGYYIAVIINYVLNDRLVFNQNKMTGKNGKVKLIKFIFLRTGSLLVDNALFYILVSIIGFHVYITRICLSIAIILVNYIWSKYKIFK